MVTASSFGQTARISKANGKTAKNKDMAYGNPQRETTTKANGRTTNKMVRESIHMLVVPNTVGISKIF